MHQTCLGCHRVARDTWLTNVSHCTDPLDVAKTRIQADVGGQKYRGLWHCMSTMVKAEGLMSLVRGSWPLILRTIPMEAMTFIGYDYTMRWTGAYDGEVVA